MGALHARQGNLAAGLPILERGLELCRAWKLSLWFPPIASALGIGYMQSGRAGDAVSLLERAVEQSEGLRLGGWHSRVLTGLGLSYLLTGRPNHPPQSDP